MVDGEREPGAASAPVLVLLHGLGADALVWERWADVLRERWPGSWIAPNLPGHGHAPVLERYSFGSMAAHVAELLPRGTPVVVLGHSLGGVVGLVLASGWFGVRVTGVVGVGVKVTWSDEELAKAAALAARPVAWFDDRAEAADRFLTVSGLVGLLPPDDPAVHAGLREVDGRWRLALDPAAFGVGAPDMPSLLAASTAPVLLARGEHDPMVTDDQLAALVPEPVALPGLGHNAHVEDPDAVAALLSRWIVARP